MPKSVIRDAARITMMFEGFTLRCTMFAGANHAVGHLR